MSVFWVCLDIHQGWFFVYALIFIKVGFSHMP
jgi:hypothetical protein